MFLKPARFQGFSFEFIIRYYSVMSQELNLKQSHYRKVPRGEIFMEQELRFGLDLGLMTNFSAFIASKSFDL